MSKPGQPLNPAEAKPHLVGGQRDRETHERAAYGAGDVELALDVDQRVVDSSPGQAKKVQIYTNQQVPARTQADKHTQQETVGVR